MGDTMRAVAINRFGAIDEMKVQTLPVPDVGPNDVLIRIESAGVAPWDVFEREGGFAEMMDGKPSFPYVLGSDGAGTVADVGGEVRRFKPGDRVYCYGFVNQKFGFYD
jgi:NADPH:quinone reductase-like Zn-dependent oxidoreductase